jgi:uncharacterized protein
MNKDLNDIEIDQKFFEQTSGMFEKTFEEYENSLGEETDSISEKIELDWIASHLGVSGKEFYKRCVDKNEVFANQGTYYICELASVKIAIRADRLLAYLLDFPEDWDLNQLYKVLNKECRLITFDQSSIEQRIKSRKEGHWICVAGIELQDADGEESVIYLEDLQLGKSQENYLKAIDLCKMKIDRYDGIELHPVNEGDTLIESRAAYLSSMNEDVFGHKNDNNYRDENGQKYEIGIGLEREKNGLIHAEKYGYLVLVKGSLKILSPLFIQEDKMSAYWMILGKHDKKFSTNMLLKVLKLNGIVHGIENEKINLIAESNEFNKKNQLISVANATLPINGENGTLEFSIEPGDDDDEDLTKIDHHENSQVNIVKAGVLLVKQFPASKGIPGKNIVGGSITQQKGAEIHLKVGEHINVIEKENVTEYCASSDGLFEFQNGCIKIVKVLYLNGDVDFNSGNITFPGAVVIKGSVSSGFSVKTGGDLSIYGTVENGSEITCFGNMKVKTGIVGSKTRVCVKGALKAKFIQEASVTVGGDVTIADHLYHAKLRCEKQISIQRLPQSARGGSVIGGYTWGIGGMDVHFAGSTSNPNTVIGVGPDPMMKSEIHKCKNYADQLHKQIKHLISLCNLSSIDQDILREAISSANESGNKIKLRYLNRLVELIMSYKKTLGENKNKETIYVNCRDNLNLMIRNRIFPKVQVFFDEHKYLMNKETLAPKFKIVDATLVVH